MISPVNEIDQNCNEKRSRFKIKSVTTLTDEIAANVGDQGTAAAGAELVDGTNSGNTAPQAVDALLQVINEQYSNGNGSNVSNGISCLENCSAASTGAKKSRFTVKAVLPPAPSTASNGSATNGVVSSDPSAQLILSKLEQIIEMNSILMCKVLNGNNSSNHQSSGSGSHSTQAPSSGSADNKNGSVISPSVSSSSVKTVDLINATNINGINGMGISSSSSGNGSNNNLASSDLSENKQPTSATADSSSSSSSTVTAEKEKIGLGRLTHYLNEMKKELELAQKQRKDTQLETQRLREKCQQLEDKLSMEQTKGVALDERVSKLKEQSKSQRQLIEQLQQQLAFYQNGSSST